MAASLLRQKQILFSSLLAKLLIWCQNNGYDVVVLEVLRRKTVAEENAGKGIGISNSLHLLSLAVDLALFLGDVYLKDSKDYKGAGEYWKSLHPLCRWGGDFSKPDGGHFSIEHNGVR